MRSIASILILMNIFLGYSQEAKDRAEQKHNVKTFMDSYQTYKMDIEAAGIATITDATFIMEGELWIDYAYSSGDENRKGRMKLLVSDDQMLKGNWNTDADNGNSYNGPIYLSFKQNGEATGQYTYNNQEYKIAILKE